MNVKFCIWSILFLILLKFRVILKLEDSFNMKIGYANVRSLNTSFNLVESACNKQNIQVLGLSEIWHPGSKIKDNVKKAWNWFATERKGERGGGTALMIAKDVKVYERKDLRSDDVEAVWSNTYLTPVKTQLLQCYPTRD